MSLWTALGKAVALWSQYGDKIEATMDIWLAKDAADLAKPPSEVVNEVRQMVGTKPMTAAEKEKFDTEQAWMNRTR